MSKLPEVLNDVQQARVMIASMHFNLRSRSYYRVTCDRFVNELKKKKIRPQAARAPMHLKFGSVVRSDAHLLDSHIDQVVQSEVRERCRLQQVTSPKVDCNWLEFVISGALADKPIGTSKGTLIAIDIINSHIQAISKELNSSKRSAMSTELLVRL